MFARASVHRYLLTRILLVVLPILLAGMAVHWYFERKLLMGQFHASLVDKATILATLVIETESGPKLEFADEFMPQYSRAENPLYFQVWTAQGSLLERSVSLKGMDLPFEYGALSDPREFQAELADSRRVRCVGIQFPARLESLQTDRDRLPYERTGVVIALAAPAEQLNTVLRRGYVQVAWTGLLSAAGVALVVWIALRRGVHLFSRVVAQVERITPADLDKSIDLASAPEEIRPIVSALNHSLARIRGFVERERRFTSDVAHELRTPISELRAAADVALRWPDRPASERLAKDAQAIALQMGGLVESLLELAVLEADGGGETSQEFDLAASTRRAVEQIQGDDDHARAVVLEASGAVRLRSNPLLWELVLRNLLSNAQSHASGRGDIVVQVRSDGAGARLCVSNPASDLTAQDAERCTERLWRKHNSPGAHGHYGLGLSIVQAACSQLGYCLRVGLKQGHFQVVVALPGPNQT